ncbi:MAG: amino acid decarboxylase [Clostridia bacterium]|nr:amino acid decarboxylase [Clostridia bacterium]
MNTPIVEFVENYIGKDTSRLHMPGHKGLGLLGPEPIDITEIGGADELYEAEGIIEESENNASALFGSAHTYYSTEGSSLTIKAMLAIAMRCADTDKPLILAARNVHKTFIFGCALLGIDVEWIYPEGGCGLCDCLITEDDVRRALANCDRKPIGLYITSPDYLGNVQNLDVLSEFCHSNGFPLLVDNAHGAYLKFLPESEHPLDHGADMCCDSAHKTLPSLTGGAYLHISGNAPKEFTEQARICLGLFASTSPSYVIMQSLDMCNKYISEGYREKLISTIAKVDELKAKILSFGWVLRDTEKLKIVIDCIASGVDGNDVMALLREHNIECEFASFEHIVMMFTPENRHVDYERIEQALRFKPAEKAFEKEDEIRLQPSDKAKSIRDAVLGSQKTIAIGESTGRICASPVVSCPPAVPIVISGEIITEDAVKVMEKYGIGKISVCIK